MSLIQTSSRQPRTPSYAAMTISRQDRSKSHISLKKLILQRVHPATGLPVTSTSNLFNSKHLITMAKQNKPRRGHHLSKKSSTPYSKPAKATVEVRYEGKAPPSTATSQVAKPAPVTSTIKATNASTTPKVDKGKSKALDDHEQTATNEDHLQKGPGGSAFVIVAGSYEKLLYGLEGSFPSSSTPTSTTLKPIFIFPAHLACVKAIAASPGGKWLATGSEDEFIKVWDLRRRKEVGSLSQHTGKSIARW